MSSQQHPWGTNVLPRHVSVPSVQGDLASRASPLIAAVRISSPWLQGEVKGVILYAVL